MRPFLFRHRRSISFVFSPEYRESGTTIMRGEQLSVLAARALPGRQIDFSPGGGRFHGRDLFLTKGVLKTATESDYERWRKNGNRILIDPVDEDVPDVALAFADVVIAASRSAERDYRSTWPTKAVATVDHHVDPRLARIIQDSAPARTARIGYFGESINAYRTPAIERRVDFVHIDTARHDDTWLWRLPHYSVHYAVRQERELDAHKPFLKGFTAAACNAVVVIQDSQREPHFWLPPDYPFWVRGELSEGSILEVLEKVRADYGGETWRAATDAMDEIKRRTSTPVIARQLQELFTR